ncbi:MAG: fasciclin domain-containing protein [Odoribacteraceae bacterium]|jgi:uncharacterized surface protein with fasciclin (FAS1) repeats|nr:fasciclin domain-containing protein [Odoribacteraceae bacterium]
MQSTKKCLTLLLSLFTLFGCGEKVIEDYYKRPAWLKGSAYDVLKATNNFNLFLAAVDRTEYKELLQGKGLCTVFAPGDEAMQAYLQEKGISGIADLDQQELELLIGYHILQYSYDKEGLLNFTPKGTATAGDKDPEGVYYKHMTFAKSPAKEIVDPVSGETRSVYYKEKHLPVFSTRLFSTLKVDGEKNYKAFFPQSQWYGNDEKLYVANAGVKEDGYAIPTDNGYIYYIDQVVKPLPTLYDAIAARGDEYSLFLRLYDKFASLGIDASITSKYAPPGVDYYIFNHSPVPMIANEWCNNDGREIGANSTLSNNAFVPNNQAIMEFANDFFGLSMHSVEDAAQLDQIPMIAVYFFVLNHVNRSTILFPDEIPGKATIYGDKLEFNTLLHQEMCSNGVFYGIDKVIIPAMFKSVSGPLYRDETHSIFTYILYRTGYLYQLINPAAEFTVFAPTNVALNSMGIRLNMGSTSAFGDETFEEMTSISADGQQVWTRMEYMGIADLVSAHVVSGEIASFAGDTLYFPGREANSTVIVVDGGIRGELSTSEPIEVREHEGTWSNGRIYSIDNALGRQSLTVAGVLKENTRYSKFVTQLQNNGFITGDGSATNPWDIKALTEGAHVMVFAPTNDALGSTILTPEELRYYFVSLEDNSLRQYLLPGMMEPTGSYKTLSVDPRLTTDFQLVYRNLGIALPGEKQMQITDEEENTVDVVQGIPLFAKDGVIYEVTKTLKIKP